MAVNCNRVIYSSEVSRHTWTVHFRLGKEQDMESWDAVRIFLPFWEPSRCRCLDSRVLLDWPGNLQHCPASRRPRAGAAGTGTPPLSPGWRRRTKQRCTAQRHREMSTAQSSSLSTSPHAESLGRAELQPSFLSRSLGARALKKLVLSLFLGTWCNSGTNYQVLCELNQVY